MRISPVAVALFLMTCGFSSVACAQNAVVGNRYESFAIKEDCGSAASGCEIIFPANPSLSVINIDRVSCFMTGIGTPYLAVLNITANQATVSPALKSTFIEITSVTPVSPGSDGVAITINTETSILLGATRVPRIFVQSSGIIASLQCRLTGTVVSQAAL